MIAGLVGMILGVLFFGLAFATESLQSKIEIVAIVIPFTIFIDGVLLLFIIQIIKPLEELTKTSKEIAAGDLSKHVRVVSKDEIGELAKAFNVMTEKLQEEHQGLEEKIDLKTTELAQKVEELERQQKKEEAIFESIGEGLVVTGNAGNIVLMNKRAEELLDLTEKDSLGKNLMDLVVLYDEKANPIPKENRPVSLALQKGEKITSRFILVKKNDEKLSIQMTSTPILQFDKEAQKDLILGSITIIRDITKEREVDRMKTEFISLASHQLRTPLSAIKWFMEMLLNGDAGQLNPDQTEFARNVSDSAERMNELVNALLNISRIELGKITVDPKPTDVRELVGSVVKELQVRLDAKKQKLTIAIPQDLPKVALDARLIRQVYVNLLSNSIKYSPENSELAIIIERKGNEMISKIVDHGYGIPKTQHDKIFQRFFRAENVAKRETDGNGLGLYLVKAIVESSHGKIQFESEENKGTTFTFSLPIG